MAGPEPGSYTRQRGVNLVEVIIALVILGIIAAIAIPSFQESSAKGRRSEGKTALVKAGQFMKTFYTENNTFTQDLTNIGLATPATTRPDGFYVLTVNAPSEECPIASCFVLHATPQGGHASDRCGVLTYSSNAVSSAELGGVEVTDCW